MPSTEQVWFWFVFIVVWVWLGLVSKLDLCPLSTFCFTENSRHTQLDSHTEWSHECQSGPTDKMSCVVVQVGATVVDGSAPTFSQKNALLLGSAPALLISLFIFTV